MQTPIIDLRSDTITQPSPAMRAQMANAIVGDDVYGEDPSVNLLQDKIAQLTGKEAALYVPSGTMANQIAIWATCRPGDEVIVSQGAHTMLYESGAGAALSGVQFRALGDQRGFFTHRELREQLHPDTLLSPPTKMVALENTHNRGGGTIFPQDEIRAIAEITRARGITLHLDGARLFNAHVATGLKLSALAEPFDTVAICLSKGLGAPVGSLLAGSAALIKHAVRRRKMLGGGMRQAGILAAAGLYALDHNVDRLRDDHANARLIGERLAQSAHVTLDIAAVQTNIIVWQVKGDAHALAAAAKTHGLLVNAIGPHSLRAVTHMDVSRASCERAAEILLSLLAQA